MSRYEVPLDVVRAAPKVHAATFASTTDEKTSDESTAAVAEATWQTISSGELVPGDIVSASSLLGKTLPADMALISSATVVTNEAMLTGESTPSSKTAIKPATLSQVMEGTQNEQELEKSMLWGGKLLLRAVPEDAQDAEVRAIVLSTGWSSTKGSLVKMMLFTKPIESKFYSDAFKFILILTIMACIGFIGSVINFVKKGVSGGEIALRLIDLFTICIPPALPAALSIAHTFALNRLKRQNIHCIAPQRISVAGKVFIAVFDKTGTLTEGGLDVRGVRLPSGERVNRLGELAEKVSDVQEDEHDVKMVEAMAVTHDVTVIDGEALGDPLETSMLAWTGWLMEESPRPLEGVHVEVGDKQPKATCARSADGTSSAALLREFEFSPALRRMSVVTQGSSVEKARNYVKGASEALAPLCDPATIPEGYHNVLHDATVKGIRVLAFAYKKVSLSYNGSQRLSRDSVESQLNFLHLLFFENKLKEMSGPAIEELQQASIPCKMCTGDAVDTAIAIARQCNLIATGQPVFVPRLPEANSQERTSTAGQASSRGGTFVNQPTELIWSDIDLPLGSEAGSETGLDPYSLTPKDPSLSLSQVGLALTGDVFTHLLTHASQETLSRLLVRAAVFARFNPELKAELIEQLQKLGHTVAFTGDGANDTGALKAADVGLSLSEAEASVAAPFTSGNDTIGSLTALIKEGRNALATQVAMFLFMAVYAISEYYSVIFLHGQATSFDNASYLYIDIFEVFFMLSFFGSVTFLIVAQTVPYIVLHEQSWYQAPDVDPDDLVLDDQDSTVVAKTNFFTLVWAGLVWNIGPPHREPVYRNYLLVLALVGLFTVSLAILFSNTDGNGMQKLYGFFEILYSFLGLIFGVVLIQTVYIFVWELVLIEPIAKAMDGPMLKWRRFKLKRRNAKISSRNGGGGGEETLEVEKKYRSVERALKLEDAQRKKMMQEKH
ncbi:HAD-like protein [Microstroma glucosiphilum]|uniref:HAD-like protein n=1 Tax=Pseudomicrostroma glucosiphilum TaxID=1684307 RepID=A0A316TYR4_9BASI|nr:HAD-like protein [Pseudomicrostroma glucosiphilum]PWN18362.1 HAD-like protein [Pseudomicrostroma glucosiphilum]